MKILLRVSILLMLISSSASAADPECIDILPTQPGQVFEVGTDGLVRFCTPFESIAGFAYPDVPTFQSCTVIYGSTQDQVIAGSNFHPSTVQSFKASGGVLVREGDHLVRAFCTLMDGTQGRSVNIVFRFPAIDRTPGPPLFIP